MNIERIFSNMKYNKIPYEHILNFIRNKKINNIFDVILTNLSKLKKFNSVEISIFVYPINRKLTSKNIKFNPFEEYVSDILGEQKSIYIKISEQFKNFFGLILGFIITLVFYIFKPSELVSIESVISVFGAYLIGKEMWNDIEKAFIRISKNLPVRYEKNNYAYKFEKYSILTYYSYLAKKLRYGKTTLMPEKMNFITQSNSQTVRMFFKTKTIKTLNSKSAHILSVHIDPELIKDFIDDGFMLSVRVTFNKKILWITKSYEFIQSYYNNLTGCLDENGKWIDDAVFFRRLNNFRKINHYIYSKIIDNKRLVQFI